jgi:hypothetical protein
MKQCLKCHETKLFTEFHKKKDSSDGYRNICKACRKGEHTERYEENKEDHNKRAVEWRQANPEKSKAIWKKHRELHQDKRAVYKKKWIDDNRGKVNAYNSLRHAEKKQRTPSWLSDFDKLQIQCMYQLAAMYSKESGKEWHVDHVVPLQGEHVSGLHVPWNLRVIPASENLRKYNKYE